MINHIENLELYDEIVYSSSSQYIMVLRTIEECIKAIDDGDGILSSMAENTWRQICISEIKQKFGIKK